MSELVSIIGLNRQTEFRIGPLMGYHLMYERMASFFFSFVMCPLASTSEDWIISRLYKRRTSCLGGRSFQQ
jgi:hypothetical protein